MKKILLLPLLIHWGFTQTTVNPDFSVIGDIIVISADDSTYLTSSGVELAFQGYVNPFARADVYLHLHEGHGLELEEAFLTLERGLPFSLGMRAGKFRPDFGKINKEHAHTFHFIESPLSAQTILGEEHWSSTGIELNALLPLPWYSNLSFAYTQSGMMPAQHNHTTEEEHTHEEETTATAINTRFSNFLDLNEITHLELGLSYYQNDGNEPRQILGADFKFKWRPDRYRSLSLQGELFKSLTGDEMSPLSGYTWASYQFNKKWNVGIIVDYIQDLAEEPFLSNGFFIGFSPVEESSVFRLKIQHSAHGDEDPQFRIIGQLIWALGPHKPHRF